MSKTVVYVDCEMVSELDTDGRPPGSKVDPGDQRWASHIVGGELQTPPTVDNLEYKIHWFTNSVLYNRYINVQIEFWS